MDVYKLYSKANRAVFLKYCEMFEELYPDFSKPALFEDKVLCGIYQRYERGGRAAVICLEQQWEEKIVLRANFDVSAFLNKIFE